MQLLNNLAMTLSVASLLLSSLTDTPMDPFATTATQWQTGECPPCVNGIATFIKLYKGRCQSFCSTYSQYALKVSLVGGAVWSMTTLLPKGVVRVLH